MKALVFGVDAQAQEVADDANALLKGLATTPMDLMEIEDPKPLGPDWVVLRSRLTGICGSDSKQVFMENADAEMDNAMTALISFPQVLGHELVATVDEVGPDARGVEPGQRVVLNPWLSCGPRGIDPPCPACQAGDLSLCWSFTEGRLSAGIHTGNAKEATGGFAELVPAHRSMVIPVPDAVPDEVAVLADPFAVSLHAVTRTPPPPGGRAVVYDTVGKPDTLEVGIRVLKGRGSLVVTGVGAPGRFEWAPLYFKEIRIVGSNAFGVEEVDGRRQHGIAHYLDLVQQGRVDVSAMLTHTFPLEQWREAFATLARQGETGAIKVAIDQR